MKSAIASIAPGDHLALIYRNRAEQFAAAIPYVLSGLQRNERCLYVAHDNSVGVVLKALRDAGADVDGAQKSGALTVATKREAFAMEGGFDPQGLVDMLKREVDRALADGYTGFRGTAEMTWAITHPAALDQLHNYEDALDMQFPASFVGLCQYNEEAFAPSFISGILRNHPRVIARDRMLRNPYYVPGGGAAKQRFPMVKVEELLAAA
jgi:chemotaxis family two-component system sensor kinase Cph1